MNSSKLNEALQELRRELNHTHREGKDDVHRLWVSLDSVKAGINEALDRVKTLEDKAHLRPWIPKDSLLYRNLVFGFISIALALLLTTWWASIPEQAPCLHHPVSEEPVVSACEYCGGEDAWYTPSPRPRKCDGGCKSYHFACMSCKNWLIVSKEDETGTAWEYLKRCPKE